MRTQEAQAKKGPSGGLTGTVMGLVLFAGVFLSLVGPTAIATSFVEVGKPGAAAVASTAPDRVSPREAIADGDILDLQLD